MSTHITGKLITVGNYTEEEQVDRDSPLARAVVVMPREALKAVRSLPMYEDVLIVKVEEWDQLRAENAALRAELAPLRETVGVAATASTCADDLSNWSKLVERADNSTRLERENAELRAALTVGQENCNEEYDRLRKERDANKTALAATRSQLISLREVSAQMAQEMRETDHEFASLRDYDAARKEEQP